MKQNNLYKTLIISGVILWLSETWYFGWNDEPCCPAEKILDLISLTTLYWGIIGDLLSNVVVNKYYLKHPIKKYKVKLPCLNCGKMHEFDEGSNEAEGIFNVFCPDKDCEDEYGFKQ